MILVDTNYCFLFPTSPHTSDTDTKAHTQVKENGSSCVVMELLQIVPLKVLHLHENLMEIV